MEDEIDKVKTFAELNEPEVEPTEEKQEEPPKEEPKAEAEPEKDEGDADKGKEEKAEEKKEEPLDFGKEGHTPKGVQQRINELSRGRREDKETISRLMAEVENLKKAQPKPKEKDRNDFENDEDWINHLAEKRSNEMFDKRIKEWEFDREMESARPMMQQNEEEARAKLEDFDEVMSRQVELPVDKETYLYVAKSKKSALINYTLRKVESVRQQLVNAPIENRLDVIKSIEKRLNDIDADIEKKKAEQKQEQQKAPNEVVLPQSSLRAPAEVKRKLNNRLDPATCSMQEWMDQD